MIKELIKEILKEELTGKETSEPIVNSDFWETGKDYVVRTVTMIYLGNLKAVNNNELLLEDCAWIPDTSRWSEFLDGKKPNEMEPYKNDVIIGRQAILDATIMDKKLKRELL